ncbi:Mitochondrial inner membrane protease atp23 [Tilletia horrida]|nr:Mitochondrial inner membrane protease atp23 [Tilletia horrida]
MSTSAQAQDTRGSRSFHRWLDACSAAFPTPDSLPWKRQRRSVPRSGSDMRNIAAWSVVEDGERKAGTGAAKKEEAKEEEEHEVWPHPETEIERQARERAERWGVQLAKYSPMIRFLSRHLSMISCDPYSAPDDSYVPDPTTDPALAAAQYMPISPLGRIVFGACAPGRAGGFQPMDPPEESGILICSNRISSKGHLERTMAHEMIHWWDHCRFNVNWANVRHNACSEIRAAALSGDCSLPAEFTRGTFLHHPRFLKQHQACARRRAIASLLDANSLAHLQGEARLAAAERAVDEVWEACWNDTRPFDEIY